MLRIGADENRCDAKLAQTCAPTTSHRNATSTPVSGRATVTCGGDKHRARGATKIEQTVALQAVRIDSEIGDFHVGESALNPVFREIRRIFRGDRVIETEEALRMCAIAGSA